MYHVSAQCVDEHMINVHYYYYYSAPGKHELKRIWRTSITVQRYKANRNITHHSRELTTIL